MASTLCVAQSMLGGLEITVADATGAVIPQADVELESSETGLKRSVQTDAAGVAHFFALPAGQYRVQVECAGFKSFQATFEVQAGRTEQHTVALEIGQVAETVEVRAAAPALMTQSTYALSVGGAPERYNRIEESGYKRASKTPLSTFSSDVDTAAYSNVRR
ncbi:MAG: von Willebrand factor type A domain-containing protein, partial [Acidobacteria bacterium]|nr:von Willebrand factor type A domain-containing protein [Acidobacteriota bacterium]